MCVERVVTSNYKAGKKGYFYVKRGMDIILSLFGILILLPIYLVVSIAIIIDTGFPVLYKAERGGYKNKSFKILKFRSMIQDADKIGGGTTALHDSRITKVGAVLRKTKLDELPQLFNVLLGDMSFIGPRPELLRYTEQYKGEEKLILQVKPGITDFSSIEFINLDEIVGEQNADEYYEKYVLQKKNQLRIKYAKEISFRTDMKIFFMTVRSVLKKAYSFLVKKEHR